MLDLHFCDVVPASKSRDPAPAKQRLVMSEIDWVKAALPNGGSTPTHHFRVRAAANSRRARCGINEATMILLNSEDNCASHGSDGSTAFGDFNTASKSRDHATANVRDTFFEIDWVIRSEPIGEPTITHHFREVHFANTRLDSCGINEANRHLPHGENRLALMEATIEMRIRDCPSASPADLPTRGRS